MANNKHKLTKQQQKAHDAEENKNFMIIVAVATLALVALMYFIMR